MGISGVKKIVDKLSTEELLEVYKKAIRFNVSKDFIMLLSEELNKRFIFESFQKIIQKARKYNYIQAK